MDVKYFNGITPKFIDHKIENFCKKINYHAKPRYVDVSPMEDANIYECVQNVQIYINKYGGKPVLGWAIWLHPHCMIEAEFHEICLTTDNRLLDVTPHKNNNKLILFLEDYSLEYSGYQINNIRKNISNSVLIDKCIENWDKIFKIMNKGERKYKHGILNICGEDANIIMKLQKEIEEFLFIYYRDLKLKPNDLCICGSNLKYVNCCKNKICL